MNYMWISDPKVVEAMTKEYGEVDQSTPLDQVVDLMINNNWEEVLVTGKAHKLLGLVTKEHLFSSMAGGLPKSSPIKEICCLELITTRPDEDLAKA
ncbi:MAG: CBS domain-containing protein, partial [Firmicutes bacterium]|nr:CBS domain-containing protein [Bacillota bacterium]